MSSRRGRRNRGRAKHWDPAAVRRPQQRVYRPYEEPEGAVDDDRKVGYWRGRFEAMVARRQPPEGGPQSLWEAIGVGGPLTNRKALRQHGVGVRGVTRSQRTRPVKKQPRKAAEQEQ